MKRVQPIARLKAADLGFLLDRQPEAFTVPCKVLDLSREPGKPLSCGKLELGGGQDKADKENLGPGSGFWILVSFGIKNYRSRHPSFRRKRWVHSSSLKIGKKKLKYLVLEFENRLLDVNSEFCSSSFKCKWYSVVETMANVRVEIEVAPRVPPGGWTRGSSSGQSPPTHGAGETAF